ncbi:hypothetical protein [Streptomyces sp. NPDC090021]|uniref:hypothetical protein n=1 Tax=Streptomyces sp. NPDC090021 TaxID=3365919 RepID=UPI003821ECDB
MAWAMGAAAPWHLAALEDAYRLFMVGSYEEAPARAVVRTRESVWRRDGRLWTRWEGRYYAALAAVDHGRGASVLAELESLIAELEHLTGEDRLLQLRARTVRAGVLIDQRRPAEAEAEAVLRVLTRTMYVTDVWALELDALVRLGQALCALGRHAEHFSMSRGLKLMRYADMKPTSRWVVPEVLVRPGRPAKALRWTALTT